MYLSGVPKNARSQGDQDKLFALFTCIGGGMKKKHIPAIGKVETLCGYCCTKQEYRVMKRAARNFINCKKCLKIKELLDG